MLTYNRFEQFKRSFGCYCKQSHPDKELVIVSHGDSEYQKRVAQHITESGRTDVRFVRLKTRRPTGALRNIAIQEASGDIVCQWDDDDLYHQDRVQIQLAALLHAEADGSYLLDHLHYFTDTRRMFWCDWTRSRREFGSPNTLMAVKTCLPSYDERLYLNEDSQLQGLLYSAGVRMALLRGFGYSYVYTCHSANICTRFHHEQIARMFGAEAETIRVRQPIIEAALANLEMQGPILVCDHLGEPVFTWHGAINPNGLAPAASFDFRLLVAAGLPQGESPPDPGAPAEGLMARSGLEMGLRIEERLNLPSPLRAIST